MEENALHKRSCEAYNCPFVSFSSSPLHTTLSLVLNSTETNQIHVKKKMHPFILSLALTTLSLLSKATPLPHRFAPHATNDLHAPPQKPTKFFEVTHPIQHPKTTPCTYLLLNHDFAYTYGHEPVSALYEPPLCCPSREVSTIILEWSASCQGRQFDRIFGIWLGGVELLRSCTAEPTRTGMYWKVQKDVTRYSSLLMTRNQTLKVFLGNVIDSTYTGVYHVNLTIYYYPLVNKHGSSGRSGDMPVKIPSFVDGSKGLDRNQADMILPISRDSPLNDGLWFEIENSTDFEYKELVIPRNVYRAVLEVYVSYHENDEFWYSNLPNEYITANNLTANAPGNGPFREVLVSLDGDLVGAIWPFTVIYTGGINPLLWRPISAIGSFDLPTYDIEITPFLEKLLDGKAHKFGFSVTNALNVWYVDANLHLWLDKKSTATKGHLLEHNVEPMKLSPILDFKGLNGQFFTGARRSIVSTGWVESSHGNITTTSIQSFEFENYMVLGKDGNMQIVNQTIEFNTSVSTNVSPLYMIEINRKFPLFLYTDEFDLGNKSYTYQSNVTLGFNEDKMMAVGREITLSSLKNFQKGEGNMMVKDNLVAGGLGTTHHIYEYNERIPGICYFRNVSSYNYTISYDHERKSCKSDSRAIVQPE